MLLEKFGIVSNERKREITELKKISDIAKEDNRLRDYENFYNKHQNFKLDSDQSTEIPLEIVISRAKRNEKDYELIKNSVREFPNDYKISSLFNTAEESFKLIDFGDNATKIKDVSELKKFAKGLIDDIYKESKYIHSMNYNDLKKALNFLKNKDSQVKEILYTATDTLEFLETVIENQIKKLEQEMKKNEKTPKAKPTREYDDNSIDLVNKEMPKSVSNYNISTEDFSDFKEVWYYSPDLSFTQTKGYGLVSSYGIFGEERIPTSYEQARINFGNDAFYETTKNPKERELVENITMASLLNLKQELNKKENEENYFTNLPEYVTSYIRPKLAFKLLEIFPDAEITLVNKTAKGRNAAKLLEIASKSGEEVSMKFKSEDLKNNKKLDSKKEDVIKYIKSMEK